MTDHGVPREKTALTRAAISRPMATAIADGLISSETSVFDYGCGKGDDIRHLRSLGYQINGWDPKHRPTAEKRAAAVVNLGFVINVIERRPERAEALRSAWALAREVLVVAARMTWDARNLIGRPMGDGLITRTGTFQKFFDQAELCSWIETTLGYKPHAAAPGIFYVFREEAAAQRFVASRVYTYRPRITIDPETQYEANRDLLEPLLTFIQVHARPPKTGELSTDEISAIKDGLGSVGRAYRLIRRVTTNEHWDEVAAQRRAELLIYVALSRFGNRPKFSQLDRSLATDLKAHFGSYKEVCIQADRLLVACGDRALLHVNARNSQIGKQTPSALYIHKSAMAEIPPVLRVYEGCARVLAGTVPSANMIKLSVTEPQVSYLTYPDFDRDPHPVLRSAITVNLRKLTVDWRDYSRSENPPLLHRKEEFLGAGDARRPLYERLTKAEVKAGLYEHPERIGTLKGWQATLDRAKVGFRGHRLVKIERN
ncbi:DNA phosphorothioation-associated putative methyltransferase [Microbacter sp. ANSKLAB05]|nr:DNA phosphorothioation-associated putative methyltransferase [Microbacter sp. ANSKLAB05]